MERQANKDLKKDWTLGDIKEDLDNINENIEATLDSIELGLPRGNVAWDVLNDLRTLVEAIMCYIYIKKLDKKHIYIAYYELIHKGEQEAQKIDKYNYLSRFHSELQIVVSHYVPTKDNCERLLLKYVDYLYKIQHEFGILKNLSKLEAFNDISNAEYYSSIGEAVMKCRKAEKRKNIENPTRYYIWSVKPFLINGRCFYEVTYSLANDYLNKVDRLIAFTDLSIFSNYAVQLNFRKTLVDGLSVRIITRWRTAIRNCEYQNFYKLVFGKEKSDLNQISKKEMNIFNYYLSSCQVSLSYLVSSPDSYYNGIIKTINNELENSKPVFIECLTKVRSIIKNSEVGKNTFLYLLYRLNNRILKLQMMTDNEKRLGNSYLSTSCYPFEKEPYIKSLSGHNVRLDDIVNCGIPIVEHKDELFARKIKSNVEIRHKIFNSVNEIKNLDYLQLIKSYNEKLWGQEIKSEKLICNKGNVYINGYVQNIQKILKKINELSKQGIINFQLSVKNWLSNQVVDNIDDTKRNILSSLFEKSRIAFVYGPAGTGKTTLIKYFSDYLSSQGAKKIFLAQTNTALDNLRKKVNGTNSQFYTVSHFVKYDIRNEVADALIIDECSTISNEDILFILENAKFKTILLVGDTFQIPSIKFGDWFKLCEELLSNNKHYLRTVYRTQNEILQHLWDEVRQANKDNSIEEFLVANKVSKRLDQSLFAHSSNDTIILCLNYDGLYGINNINEYLQNCNSNKAYIFRSHIYKVGDPVLFNESNRFYPAIYNNMKGKIQNIIKGNNYIQFDIAVDRILSGYTSLGQTFNIIGHTTNGNSIIQFIVKENISDEDTTTEKEYIMPFNVTYAMSIHKAQGLEFDDVKLVIDGNREETLSLNVFYTAITRTKNKLNIYWTPKAEHDFLERIKKEKDKKDYFLLKNCFLKNYIN